MPWPRCSSQELLYPGDDRGLPYSVLLAWDGADWTGILFAIAVIDLLGIVVFTIPLSVIAPLAVSERLPPAVSPAR